MVEFSIPQLLENAERLSIILAIWVGALFAIFKLKIFKDLKPRLTISQEVSHRFIGDNYVHVGVMSTLHNPSKVRVEIRRALFQVQRIAPASDAEVEQLRQQVFERQEKDNIQWPPCDELTLTWQKNQTIVDPGESLQITSEFIISSTVQSVLVFTYIYNSRNTKGSQVEGWPVTTFYDIPDTKS